MDEKAKAPKKEKAMEGPPDLVHRENGLNVAQSRFVQEFIKDPKRNATQAAIRAGYSEADAKHQGAYLRKHPKIIEEIQRATAKLSEETEYTLKAHVLELNDLIERAKLAGNLAVEFNAIKAKGMAHGLYESVLNLNVTLSRVNIREAIEQGRSRMNAANGEIAVEKLIERKVAKQVQEATSNANDLEDLVS